MFSLKKICNQSEAFHFPSYKIIVDNFIPYEEELKARIFQS